MGRTNLYYEIKNKLKEVDDYLGLGVMDDIAYLAIPAVMKDLNRADGYSYEEFERAVFREYLRAHNEIRSLTVSGA
jgi:hypothetical protein